MLALALSLTRENKGLTVALVVLYTLAVALVAVVSMVPSTVRASVDAFTESCNTADCYIYTLASDGGDVEAVREVAGVNAAAVRNSCECTVRMPDGKLCSMSFLSVPDDGFMQMWLYGNDGSGVLSAHAGAGLAVNERYTLFSDLAVGDAVEVLSPIGNRTVEVSDIAAAAECVISLRDEFSWYEDESYGYFYVSDELYEELFGAGYGYRHWLLDIDESSDAGQVAEAARAALGAQRWSSTLLTDDSIPHKTIYGNLDMLDSVCTYLPGLILVICLGFSVLFIGQVVLRSRAFIGLLKALGMGDARISGIFLLYVLAPVLCAMALGVCVGMVCAYALVGLYVEQFTLPNIVPDCDAALLALRLAGIAALAAAACVLACRSLGKVEPAEVCGGFSDSSATKPSALARALRVGPFAKVAISLALQSKVRVANCAVCIAGALCLVAAGIMLYFSMDASVSFTFEDRLLYDALVDTGDAEGGPAAIGALEEAASCEPVLRAYAEVSADAGAGDAGAGDAAAADAGAAAGEYIQVNGIVQDAELIALYDAQGERIAVPDEGMVIDEGLAHRLGVTEGDAVCIQGTRLQVAAIAREYVNPISYVSVAQMERLGIATSSAVAVALADSVSHNEFREAVYEADPGAYVLFLDSQRKNMESSMRAIDIPIVFVVALSVLIGLVIVYNMTELSIVERRREYATLLVLGVGNARIAGITLAESVGELALALLVGCPVAYFAAAAMLEKMCSVSIQYPVVLPVMSMAIACLVTSAYVVAATLMAQARVRRWNPLAILNAGD